MDDGKIVEVLLSGLFTVNMHSCRTCLTWARTDALIGMITVAVVITEVLEDTTDQEVEVLFMEPSLILHQLQEVIVNGEASLQLLKIK